MRSHWLCVVVLSILLPLITYAQKEGSISGTIHTKNNSSVAGAKISILNARHSTLRTITSDSNGKYSFENLLEGSYEIEVTGQGFLQARKVIQIFQGQSTTYEIVLESPLLTDFVTVTSDIGQIQDKDQTGQQVNIITESRISERAIDVVAQVANEEVGIALQRTSPTIGGIFIRGLTGKNVVVYLDGIRYSNSAQRGGINTFLNLIEPSNLRAVEILRGPNSSQYGSDSLGGSIQFLSQPVPFSASGIETHVQTSFFASTATAGFGQSTRLTLGGKNFGLVTNIASRRFNTVRPGNGIDSHAALTRFLGLQSNIINGTRLPDTAFTEYGGNLRFNYTFTPGHQILFSYQRQQQDGGKRYDQLLGGDGNNIADLRNLMLDFGYIRYDSEKILGLDNFTASFSFNNQREERVNQGGNGNPAASIISQYERTKTYGIQLQATKLFPKRNNILIGADYYHDRFTSPSYSFNPITKTSVTSRPRIPNNARYENYGFYIQDLWNIIPERLRFSGSLRYSAASYRARSIDSPLVKKLPLFPNDSMRADSVTFRTSTVLNLTRELSIAANFSRGFRAPHMTDLGTLGITGNGFEVAAPDVVGLNSTIGDSANSRAISTGRPVVQVKPEISWNYETSLRYRNKYIDTDLGAFILDIDDNLTKQALILPQGAVGKSLGGEIITSQTPSGAVFVASASNPVLVRANFDKARFYGFEYTLDTKISNCWNIGGNFTYIHAKDKANGLPPNIEGGVPAPNGNLHIRYNPPGKRYWVEMYSLASYRQERLSSLDLEDRRTGALRSRKSISNFFLNGATVRGLVAAGSDGKIGTSDDILKQTGETLSQVQNRILGNEDELPLFTRIPGFVTLNLRGSFKFGEHSELFAAFENITDRNYRGTSWGIDAPGRNLTLRYTVRF